MAEPLRHRQTKGAETDMFYLTPPRHISTLPIATVSKCPRYVRFSSDSEQIADVPTCRIKCAPAARETACEPQVHPCAEQWSRTSRTRAPVALTDPSEPWWTKPVHALQLQGLSWVCDHRPWSCERVLYSLHRRVLAVLHPQAPCCRQPGTGRGRSCPARRARRKCRRAVAPVAAPDWSCAGSRGEGANPRHRASGCRRHRAAPLRRACASAAR